MDPKTLDHLRVVERNRDLARALLDPSVTGLGPTPWEWVAVMAFNAAVHAVNAYLWEARRYQPRNHGDRWVEIQSNLPISGCRRLYQELNRAGYSARYDERFVLSERDARRLVEVHYRRVEATVMQALGQALPAW